IAFAVEAPLSGGFAPASSLAALDAYLDAVSAGQPLSAEEEAEVLVGGR
ncbi:MAG TPA: anti-sigma factor, partial [Methylomirabilota bacterium]|nr:anti-sigma factor [Methylomirabilota bacterium]